MEIEMATKEKTTKKTATKDDFGLRKGTNTAKAATDQAFSVRCLSRISAMPISARITHHRTP